MLRTDEVLGTKEGMLLCHCTAYYFQREHIGGCGVCPYSESNDMRTDIHHTYEKLRVVSLDLTNSSG